MQRWQRGRGVRGVRTGRGGHEVGMQRSSPAIAHQREIPRRPAAAWPLPTVGGPVFDRTRCARDTGRRRSTSTSFRGRFVHSTTCVRSKTPPPAPTEHPSDRADQSVCARAKAGTGPTGHARFSFMCAMDFGRTQPARRPTTIAGRDHQGRDPKMMGTRESLLGSKMP